MTLHRPRRSTPTFATALAWGALTSALPFNSAIAQDSPPEVSPTASNANVLFQTLDRRESSVFGTQGSAAEASRDKISIIVWGGNVDLQRQAYAAALDLRDQGIPLAFIVGPSQLPTNDAVMIEIYGRGVSAAAMMHGLDNIATLRPDLRTEAVTAYGRMFPREAAALGLVPTP